MLELDEEPEEDNMLEIDEEPEEDNMLELEEPRELEIVELIELGAEEPKGWADDVDGTKELDEDLGEH